jgi:hypothetical protein
MASLLACECSPGWTAQAAGKPSPVISLCNKPFVFGFGTWKNARTEFLSKPDGKPNGPSRPLPFLYTISLKLPSPLKEGATYTIHLRGVNTSQENVSYVHQPRATRSLAVHAIQTGYRPDDPCKRAYLSFWMGVDKDVKNGSCTPDVDTFELVDALGKTVFTGRAELLKKEALRDSWGN